VVSSWIVIVTMRGEFRRFYETGRGKASLAALLGQSILIRT